MSGEQLLQYYRSCGIDLWATGGRLRYSGPQDVLTPEVLERLSQEKQQLLEALYTETEKSAVHGSSAQPPPSKADKKSLPLSFAQERMWVLYQEDPQSPAYNIPFAIRLAGPLNKTALEQSVQELIRRHHVFQTTCTNVDGQPVQRKVETRSLSLEEVDWRSTPESERESNVKEWLEQEARIPFDLSKAPLLRTRLGHLQDDVFVFLLVTHHYVVDGLVQAILKNELSTFYNAFSQGQPSPLPELNMQYVDLVQEERQRVNGPVSERQLQYWKNQLQGVSPLTNFPKDFLPPEKRSYQGDKQSFVFSRPLSDALRRLSRQEGVTLYMVLLAAFQILLYRYTDQQDIVVATPSSHRVREESELVIGSFWNNLLLRTIFSGNPTFKEVLDQVRDVAIGAFANQELPFERIVQAMDLRSSADRRALSQMMFDFHSRSPEKTMQLSGLQVSPYPLKLRTSVVDLRMFILDEGHEISGNVEFSTDLFDRSSMYRLVKHYQNLIERIVQNPAQRIRELPLLTEVERQQLLVEWNATQTDFPRERCIQELFENQTAKTPEAIAVVLEEQHLTYHELNIRANHLAHTLRQHGVGPEVCVGLCMDRSLDMVVGILGILKAGGAYVPLDPKLPSGRMAFMLQDADIAMVLTQDVLRAHLPANWTGPVVALDTEWATIALRPGTAVESRVTSDNLAYIIYTSGSTGVPKGIAIPQRAVLRLVLETNYVDLTAADRVAQTSTISFDAATFELWGALLHGGQLVMIPKDIALSPRDFAASLQHYGITTMFLTTALFNQMAREAPRAFRGVRHLLFGGEAVDPQWVREILQTTPPQRLLHVYGPTESTTFTTWHVTESAPSGEVTVPIGQPLANTQTYVLDRTMQPVPVGVYGELYIGGDGLARNYLKQPALTAEKFVSHPFSTEPGARLYKTGDVVRYRADGAIEFLGRVDHQVKLRGFRIELGEIETILSQHPAVQEAVALVREDEPGEKRLVAYVVADKEPLSSSDLRRHLKQRVPEYMVPALFVMLDALPLTPNGKVDRRALPKPDGSGANLVNYFVPPRSPLEEALAEMWREVLRLKEVGVHDNFFDLGGHSLLATQVISRVRELFHMEVPLRHFFEGPTIDHLARAVETARGAGQTTPTAQPLVPYSREDTLPLSFAQQRLWFLHQLEPESPAYHMPLALRLQGFLDVEALEQSLQALVDRHEALRTCFPDVAGKPSQVFADSLSIPFTHRDLRELPEANRETTAQELAREEALRPFALATGPVIRAMLLQLADSEYVLLVTMHHIISDGWSMGVVSRELAALYEACVAQHPSPLPPLPIQYADFAIWQRQLFTGEVLEQQLTYWWAHLADLAPLEMPTDRPRPPIQTYSGAKHALALPHALKAQLQVLSREAGVTLAITLLAAFQVLLARYTGQTDIAVGSPIANRNRREIEGLIGFFVNSLVMRTNLSGDPSFREVLRRVKEVALGAYDHQDLPFERLVEELHPERDPSRNPLFQVTFAMQNAPFQDFTLPGVTVRPFRGGATTTRFDLECHMRERPEGLSAVWCYNTDLFDADTIARFGRHFQAVLEGVVRQPEEPLSQLQLLSEREAHQQLVEWNTTEQNFPTDRCLHELIDASASRTPEAVAMVCGEKQITYGECTRRANQLAQYLRRHGVGPDTPVGVCLDRSVELVISLLGILKAGGAYVPLEPSYPQERLAFMLANAQPVLLLMTSGLVSGLPEYGGKVICLDTAWPEIAKEAATCPCSGVCPDHLAYILYTSGSTGTPKGVMISHRAMGNHMAWLPRAFSLTAADCIIQKTPMSFDASGWEFFVPLLVGARLALVDSEAHREPPRLIKCLTEQQVTVLQVVPTLFRQLVEQGLAACGSPKYVFCGGEVLPLELVRQWQATARGQLVNLYGPTETTIDVLSWVCEAEEEQAVPLGRPTANTQVYLLDRAQQPVPIVVAGELYIGGRQVARGYRGRPDLTAEKFVPHPFSHEPGMRLYRTGDRARYRADGAIEFLGRVDQQVKLRGYRIELGEIEAVLAQHPLLAEAVALMREDVPGDQRLVAYIVPDPQHAKALLHTEGVGWAEQHLTDWHTLHNHTYTEGGGPADPTFNITGWNSSYTGQPIPADEMREWVEATVARLRALQPHRVLEIGCGTGLLLYRLAPHCTQYLATDFSEVALQTLGQGLAARDDLAHVTLEQRLADDFTEIAPGSFDTVIINSVTQYLPSLDYLGQVLERAVHTVKPGGHIVVGDVRSLPLLTAYHTSIQFHQAAETLSRQELGQHIQQAQAREEELVIDPAFFTALARELPRIRQVEVLLKQGQTHNELTRFRYDVILHIEQAEQRAEHREDEIHWREWSKEEWSVERLQAWLQAENPVAVGFTSIPNARLQREAKTLQWLAKQTGPSTVGEFREALNAKCEEGVDPQEFWDALASLPYWCELSYTGTGEEGTMTAVLRRRSSGRRPCLLPASPRSPLRGTGWTSFCTNPLKAKLVKTLIPQLRTYLQVQVPEYMIPSAFVTMDALPLTPNGKVDRHKLPAPEKRNSALKESFSLPATPMERLIAEVWREVLELDQVGVYHNFFDLGGHSLSSIEVISKLEPQLGFRLNPRDLMFQSLGQLAVACGDRMQEPSSPSPKNGQPSSTPQTFWTFWKRIGQWLRV